jgi:hypothetical protein
MDFLNKPLRDLTDAELQRAYAHWDFKVRSAAHWGAALAFADSQRLQVEAEQIRRREAPRDETNPLGYDR